MRTLLGGDGCNIEGWSMSLYTYTCIYMYIYIYIHRTDLEYSG